MTWGMGETWKRPGLLSFEKKLLKGRWGDGRVYKIQRGEEKVTRGMHDGLSLARQEAAVPT